MLIVSCEGHHDKINCSEEEIILTGPPSSLTGYITFQNRNEEAIFVKDLPLNAISRKKGISKPAIDINTILPSGEVTSHFTHFKASPTTPPGMYHSKTIIGGKERIVKMIVQENMEVELIPRQINFMGIAPGRIFKKQIILVNKGNVPILVPVVKHNTTIDMDLICRNLSLALRETGDEGTTATLDHFIKGLKKDITGWLEISIKEAGQMVKPGKNILLNITFKLPQDINQQRQYEGEIRLFDKEIDYQIIQNPEQNIPRTRRKKKAD